MNFKSISLAIFTLAVASVASAQTLFHDDWESYRPGTQDWQANYAFGSFDVNLEAGETYPTVVEGPKDGVTPYSGNQMYDFRGSIFELHARRLGTGVAEFKSDKVSVLETEIRFAIPSSYASKESASFSLGTNLLSGGISVTIDTSNDTLSGAGAKNKPITKLRGIWHVIRLRINWLTKTKSAWLDSDFIGERPIVIANPERPPYTAGFLQVAVAPLESYVGQFPIGEGSPGILVDDLRWRAVPEPSSFVVAASAIVVFNLIKRKRVTHES